MIHHAPTSQRHPWQFMLLHARWQEQLASLRHGRQFETSLSSRYRLIHVGSLSEYEHNRAGRLSTQGIQLRPGTTQQWLPHVNSSNVGSGSGCCFVVSYLFHWALWYWKSQGLLSKPLKARHSALLFASCSYKPGTAIGTWLTYSQP
jgi:hypothetical protein